jgi:hypothetical protein
VTNAILNRRESKNSNTSTVSLKRSITLKQNSRKKHAPERDDSGERISKYNKSKRSKLKAARMKLKSAHILNKLKKSGKDIGKIGKINPSVNIFQS